mmetsp:Transcript_95138/g.182960  ORF Transcript_95138/g.182960 Transcript_95138/m.182960 type:complete len:154 (+) Transcript_95138:113-574(+)
MGFSAAMLAYFVLACSFGEAVAGSHTQIRSEQVEEWWPFDSWSSSHAPAPKPQLRANVVARKSLAETKQALFTSEVFRRKTASLCTEAKESEQAMCENVASERLFCAMFTRHAEQFQGLSGVAEQRQKCTNTNIMETALEAARDANALMPDDD